MGEADITRMLARARDGDAAQMGAVFEAMYPDLRRLANSRLRGGEATLTPTALVHELFLRTGSSLSANDRNHFFALAASAMRWILVDYARQRGAERRGGDQIRVSLDDQIPGDSGAHTELLALDEALDALNRISEQRRQIVELRYFGGLEFSVIAEMLGCSERTVYREWERARAFLQAKLEDPTDGR